MMKTATVQAQQKWEYHCITRRTESYLNKELNGLGQQGWELTSVAFAKDPKGENAWIAFLKRPFTGHASHSAEVSDGQTADDTPTESPKATSRMAREFDMEGEEFDIQDA